MTNYPYILFNKSPEQLRLLGARGGRAYGRNQRDRRAQMPTPPATGSVQPQSGAVLHPPAASALARNDPTLLAKSDPAPPVSGCPIYRSTRKDHVRLQTWVQSAVREFD